MIPEEILKMQGSPRSKSQTLRERSSIYFRTPSDWARNNLLYMESYGHFFCLNQYRIDRDPFDSYLLILTLDGSGTVLTDSGKYTCLRHDIALIDCNHRHTYYANESWEFLWLHFNGNPAKELFSLISDRLGTVARVEGTQLYTHYFPFLTERSFGSTIADEVTISSYIHRLLADLLSSEYPKAKKAQQPHMIHAAIEYIEHNCSQPITLDCMAAHLKMSKSAFCHAFKESTGYSPYDFLITTRINKAKYLLKTTSKSVNEI